VRSSGYGIVVVKNNRSNRSCRAHRTLRCPSAPSNRPNLPRMPPQARQTTTATPPDYRVKSPRACAQSARRYIIYIYTRQEQQMGQEVCACAAPRQATPRTSTRLGRVAGAQTRRQKREKSRHDRGGGHSRRCHHPKPPGIDPFSREKPSKWAQKGLLRQNWRKKCFLNVQTTWL